VFGRGTKTASSLGVRPFIAAALSLLATSIARPAAAETISPFEERLLQLINSTRAEHGLGPVALDEQLSDIARSHSLDMTEGGYFSHLSPSTGSPGDRLRRAGVSFRLSGENIAFDRNVEAAHQALMESPSHRRNILDPEFTHVGLGVVSSGSSVLVTEHFVRPGPGFVATAHVPGVAAPERPLQQEAPLPVASSPWDAAVQTPWLGPVDPGWPAPWPSMPATVWVLTPDGFWRPMPPAAAVWPAE
jgi:uncharacterized protein YkwD